MPNEMKCYRIQPNTIYIRVFAFIFLVRYMIFSTYEAQNAKIVRTDLAGKDAVELFVYPEVLDITGITIDYEEDR